MSSGAKWMPSARRVSLNFVHVSPRAAAVPTMTSECPPIYFVPAMIEMSAPWSRARKKNGVAQVLSNITVAP